MKCFIVDLCTETVDHENILAPSNKSLIFISIEGIIYCALIVK